VGENQNNDTSGSAERSEAGVPVRRLGSYNLLRELGRGAQGVVFLAEDIKLRRKVALKMLTGAGIDSRDVRERFQREAELTSKFEHPGICGVHEIGSVDGVPYIAMQYVQGMTLASILERARAGHTDELSTAASESVTIAPGISSKGQQLHDLIKLIERTARALHVAHEADLVHRDVKPGNIMVTPEGNPVLLDFGLARDLGAEGKALTQSGQIIGTPLYLAPEQISAARGSVDRRTDVYALGVILFECLTLERPFDATTWDQLFHQILHGELPSPRRINPRIPQDLCTIIEVAMEREQPRRYQTALALAEDLRRVRAFEPIQAKAAGPLARALKWAKRNPGRATAAGAAAVFAFVGVSAFAYQALARQRIVRANLQRAGELIAAGDLDGSLEATARALERDPRSPEALEFKARIEREREAHKREELHGQDAAQAEAARAEAAAHHARYIETYQRMRDLSDEVLRDRDSVFSRSASAGERESFAAKERELQQLQVESQTTLVAYEEALQRAARRETPWGEVSDATEQALAEYYMVRWRTASATGDEAWTTAMRTAAEQHDRRHEYERELLGRGTLTVQVVPADASLHLFRYEDVAVVPGERSIPRLVPVPTAGIGRSRPADWIEGFRPGDGCLVVRDIEPASIADSAGLRPGDLILRIQGQRCGPSVFVASGRSAKSADDQAMAHVTRVLQIDGAPVESLYDWVESATASTPPMHRVRFEGAADEIDCDLAAYTPLLPQAVALGRMPGPMTLSCLHDGQPLTLEVAANEPTGIDSEVTTYPLIYSTENRIAPGANVTVDPGSYLLLARAPGRVDQRVPVLVERLADASLQIDLIPEGTAPPGFVYVPPGKFTAGGDPKAFQPRSAQTTEVPGFFIARKEVTNRDWYEFVNDPDTSARLSSARAGTNLPRDERIMARKGADDRYTWDVYKYTSADSPVLGVSWTDVRDFLAWRNRKAEAAGEAWRYDLPSEVEWEKAARGVDGRCFPWGNRFDPSLTVCLVRKPGFLLDAAGGFEPCDESPYGVLDMAGSREEWLRDVVPSSEPPRYRKRGGRWNSYVESVFRVASRAEASQDYAAAAEGFRLVLRKP
jgi:formylglycine-generating enzyme required for sulfatase activity/tRNA A-37 threonylcarbamoyl transferase component Bud32